MNTQQCSRNLVTLSEEYISYLRDVEQLDEKYIELHRGNIRRLLGFLLFTGNNLSADKIDDVLEFAFINSFLEHKEENDKEHDEEDDDDNDDDDLYREIMVKTFIDILRFQSYQEGYKQGQALVNNPA